MPDRGWPFIRGPEFDGHSREIHLAETWPSAGPPVLWHRALGEGYSAFTAAGDRVFTQYQTIAGQYLACLHADTGETIWEYRYDWPYEAGGMYPGPRATPTLNGGRVYFAAPSGLVGCLTWDGQLVWEVKSQEKFAGRGADFGYSCSPTVVDGLVLLPVGGPGAAMVALDKGLLFGFDLKDVQAKAHRPSRGNFRCLDLATARVPRLGRHPRRRAGICV